ncbi:ATP-dependent DNA helicase RecG [Pleionea sediminis]|uniref:ATP-dependent DNA helicase RecG n=1 Tax=Pleionea sediminis TaxID=2569479 RepID=UPI001184A00A|nr:ATP-dependent DNA helicase RecG [Pleionea sediminis]
MNFKDYDIGELKGVGPAMREKLARLGLESWQDVLFHLPHRYEDRTRVVRIGDLVPGESGLVLGTVEHCEITFGKRRALVCRISDGSGFLDLRFFYFSKAQKDKLARGRQILCYGDISSGRSYHSMIHPEVKYVSAHQPVPVDDRLTPIYPVTEGVKQFTLRKLTDQVLAKLKRGQLKELLPESIKSQHQMADLADALFFVHRPPPGVDLNQMYSGQHPAKQRLALEELFAYNLSMLKLRSKIVREPAQPLEPSVDLTRQLLETLPFELTGAQQKVIGEIQEDLKEPHPMLRLVQGDVGSGKTLVAAMAALQAIEQGYQVALMAPTEILAEQHWNNFSGWFEKLNIQCGFLVSKLKAAEKRQMLEQIASGDAQMVIGTHALFQDGVNFHNLVLVIVDEQHRFGVHQRMALKEKSKSTGFAPHQLIMTATPIPRTLAMTAYADLDTSIIDELPPGRKPVQTVVLPDSRREQVVQRVADVCRTQGVQAYWVCTLIEESEELQCQAAEESARQLQEAIPDIRVGLVHGKMKPFDKQAVMDDFKAGNIDLLVATTVIEVGVDVPNASLMVIENPERLGLAQLHQLRGRVGRGHLESHCVLLYHPPLSQNGQTRLETMRATNDGFKIAEKDLEIRGPGEVLGTRQTGLIQFKIADVIRDRMLLPDISKAAKVLYKEDPVMSDELIERWLGRREVYGQV